jgi:hypothetical protein
MNSLLVKHRPKRLSKEEFEKYWEASGEVLSVIFHTLSEMKQGLDTVKADDFADTNHYVKLVSQLVKKQQLETILAMLPNSAKM